METVDPNSSDELEARHAELERNELQWVPWLRGVMWVNTVVAAVATLYGLYQISFVGTIIKRGNATGQMWLTPELAFEIAVTFGLPVLYLYASIGCLSRKPQARVAMVIYSWCRLGLIAYELADVAWHVPGTPYEYIRYLAPGLIPRIYEGGLVVITLLFVTRQPIKSLFGHHPVAGFAVLPSDQDEEVKRPKQI